MAKGFDFVRGYDPMYEGDGWNMDDGSTELPFIAYREGNSCVVDSNGVLVVVFDPETATERFYVSGCGLEYPEALVVVKYLTNGSADEYIAMVQRDFTEVPAEDILPID